MTAVVTIATGDDTKAGVAEEAASTTVVAVEVAAGVGAVVEATIILVTTPMRNGVL